MTTRELLSQNYLAIKNENPFLHLREKNALTQEQVAALVGVTVQYVYRHENGLVNTPSLDYADRLIRRLSENNAEERAVRVLHDYEDWVALMRSAVRSLGLQYDKLMFGPYRDVNHLRAEHPFVVFMFNFNTVVGTTLEYDGELRSQQLFNRFLCLHPRAVQLYLAGDKHIIDGVLGKALIEVGLDQASAEFLEREVAAYNKRVKK